MSEFVAIDFDEIKEDRETEKAHLIVIDGVEHWIPKSQTDRVYYKTKKIYISEWIAEQKGFI